MLRLRTHMVKSRKTRNHLTSLSTTTRVSTKAKRDARNTLLVCSAGQVIRRCRKQARIPQEDRAGDPGSCRQPLRENCRCAPGTSCVAQKGLQSLQTLDFLYWH